MNGIVFFLLKQVVNLLLGSGIFERILAVVERWADKEISGIKKKQGVLDELEIIGLNLTKSGANFAVEAAVQYLKAKA
jgi:hypothetical protein